MNYPRLLFALLVCSSTMARTQWATLDWQRCIGGPSDEEGFDMAAYPGGGFVITGNTESGGGDIGGYHPGGGDLIVARLDANGGLLWVKAYGGSGGDNGNSICVTEGGEIWVTGLTTSTDGDVTGLHTGGEWPWDVWVIKLDAEGELLWQRACGGSDQDQGLGITPTLDGGCVVTGFTTSVDGDLLQAAGPVEPGSTDMYVLRFSQDGDLLWQRRIGGLGYQRGWSVCIGDDDQIYVSGLCSVVGGEMTDFHGEDDACIAKLTLEGDLAWARCYGGSSVEEALAICAVDGGLVFAGPTASNDGDVTWASDWSDFWVVRTDLDGNIIWGRTASQILWMDMLSYSAGQDVVRGPEGGVVVATRLDWQGADQNLSAWWFGPDGSSAFSGFFGGPYSDYCHGIAVDQADGGIGLIGTSFLEGGDISGGHGGNDAWVIELNSTMGFEEVVPGQEVFVWYDAAEGSLCATGSLEITSLRVLDAQGRIVFSAPMPPGGGRVQLPALPMGVYVAEVLGAQRRLAMRTVVIGAW